MKSLILVIMLFSSLANARNWDGVIYNAFNQQEVTADEFTEALEAVQLLVIGEKHYTQEVQLKEAQLLELFANVRSSVGAKGFLFGWEFLAVSEQKNTSELYKKFLDGELSALEFVRATQSGNGDEYAPLFDSLKSVNGELLGLNLTRTEKSPVTKGGISAADPSLVPPNFEVGGKNYYERFEAVMSGHVPPSKLQNYYEAQCLTDDVMAYQTLLNIQSVDSMAIVAGSFHTDYFDGTIAQLKRREPNLKMLSVKIVDASDYKESDLLNDLFDAKYGPVAEYVIFVNEPSP